MNNNEKTAAYYVERAERRRIRNERRANALTACGIIAAVAVAAVLLAGAGKAEREYTEDVIIVQSGDTLSGIAEMYCPNDMDKREYVHMLEVDNDCTALIRPGDVLTVRRYAE